MAQISSSLLLLFSICAILLSAPGALAGKFGFSPPSLEFEYSEEDICKEIYLFSDKPIVVYIQDAWSDFPSTRAGEYVNDEDFLNYTSLVIVDGEKSVPICRISRDGNRHYGLLVFNVENSSISGGMWVRIDGDGKNILSERNLSTMSSEHEIHLLNPTSSSIDLFSLIVLVILVESAIILSCILPILLLNSRKSGS